MKAMLWKELRENLKWAVLALLALILAEFYALNQDQFLGFNVQGAAPLCKTSFLMITTFGCAAVGLVLGLVQVLPEQRRDQWAALIHRPVPRDTIYRGKALAGFLLYLFAAVPPFLACIWYVATPNHFAAPFTLSTIQPGVADIFAGAMYYFAALFVALRRGPWFGTRALGLLTAVGGSFVVTSYVPFRNAIEASIYGSLLLFIAAWGAILTNGSFRVQPWIARLALLAVAFYGVCTAGDLLETVWGTFSRPQYVFEKSYDVTMEGLPVLQSTSKNGHSSFTDLQDHPLNDPRLTRGSSYRYLLRFSPISSYIGDSHGIKPPRISFGYRNSETYLQQISTSFSGDGEIWYYVPADRLFIGFNQYNRVRLGAFGQNGFSPGYQPVTPFRSRLLTEDYLIPSFTRFAQTVYFIDFADRSLTTVFAQPGTEVFGANSFQSYTNDPAVNNLAAVSLLHEARVIDRTGKVLATLPYDQDTDHFGRLSAALNSTRDRVFLEYAPSSWIPFEIVQHMPTFLEERDLQGHVLNSYTLPALPETIGVRSWEEYIRENLQTPAYFFGDMVYQEIGATLGSKRLAGDLHGEFGPMWGYTKDVAIRISILSMLLAIVTFFWARGRYFSPRRAWAWAGFVLLFNLAGLLTFRLVADWPVLVDCPACRRQRPVNQPLCPHCQAPWPTPQRDGTEIFEASPAPASASV